MAQAILVEQRFDAGRALIEALDRARFPVVAALWNYADFDPFEEGVWQLMIATPRVFQWGHTRTYREIQEILRKRKSKSAVPVDNIYALSSEDPFVTKLQIYAGTDGAPFVGNSYLTSTTVGNIHFLSALIYRAERLTDSSGRINRWAVKHEKDRKTWLAQSAVIETEDLFFTRIEVAGTNWPQRRTKRGVSARLDVMANAVVNSHGKATADVTRWVILGGLLRDVEMVARDVSIEGWPESPASANQAV
jgi:hypothetical protein